MAYSTPSVGASTMEGVLNLRRSFLEAVVVGLLATSVLFLPPLELGTRANLRLYDLWSRLGPVPEHNDVLLVRVDNPAALTSLAQAGRDHHAKLLVTTLAQPPSAIAAAKFLGPVDLPVGTARLRRTRWPHGGHLWFQPDIDGVVRRDQPLIDDAEPTPSLGFYAAERVAEPAPGAADDPSPARSPDSPRWLRFYPGHPFAEAEAGDVLHDTSRLAGKIVIAGRAEPQVVTPVGLHPPVSDPRRHSRFRRGRGARICGLGRSFVRLRRAVVADRRSRHPVGVDRLDPRRARHRGRCRRAHGRHAGQREASNR
jgi:hypothetical protein